MKYNRKTPVEDAPDDDEVHGDPVAVQDENNVSLNVSNLDELLHCRF